MMLFFLAFSTKGLANYVFLPRAVMPLGLGHRCPNGPQHVGLLHHFLTIVCAGVRGRQCKTGILGGGENQQQDG